MGLFFSSLPRLAFFLFLCFLPRLAISSSELFESWCKQHGRSYSSEAEKLRRFRIFQDNMAFINRHNSVGNFTYSLALNDFADLTHDEFKAARLRLAVDPSPALRSPRVLALQDVPASLDWREKGAVTPVKDQGSCGDCWAFSATGAMESINQIFTGSLISLSEQELCDCDKTYNMGCNGGLMDYAFQWVIKNGGIDTEEDYPYQAADQTCKWDKVSRRVVSIDGYVDVPANNENQLLQAVAKQPVSVGLCGSERAFQLYSKGIFSGPCSTSLDHAGLIVGYGSENGVHYWIMKNSWGKRWGMNGYVHLLRNGGSKQGICGIYQLASYPTKQGPNPPTPPPPPGPTKCSLTTYCPPGNTCCCTWRILGFCLSWGCCGMDSAICCKDQRYCCPHEFPICETKTKQCFKSMRNSTLMTGVESKDPTSSFRSWRSLYEAWAL
ncbi:hypothetical protein H6P81_003767 [Aristolochia fimbriata]|uniref:Uncharacterized protein n=1 Tax=Aristolochia fimbriata TaxID=158543 RepID=A0AAV7FFD4_ARIFI|nr:hypothetical protein H6P81_003767 [Aristolochia fimbriata]